MGTAWKGSVASERTEMEVNKSDKVKGANLFEGLESTFSIVSKSSVFCCFLVGWNCPHLLLECK